MNTLHRTHKVYFTVFLRFDKFHRQKLKNYILSVDDFVCLVVTMHTNSERVRCKHGFLVHFNQTKPNHGYNININMIATIILMYKYNCHLHFIKTIHLFTSLRNTHAHEETRTETACVCVFFAPHSTKNKLIKLNDTIMEIN